jgi:signal transduction histidine kinase
MPKIYIDNQKMELVLQNLIENAVKYTPEFGKIEIAVEFTNTFFKFKIKDNGVGIPEKDQKKLFSKFFRAENVMRMQTEGSGLGLFIVKNIIIKHGGDITYKSQEGKGTEFVITLPMEKN